MLVTTWHFWPEGVMSDRSTALLQHHLKELKLPTFLRGCLKSVEVC